MTKQTEDRRDIVREKIQQHQMAEQAAEDNDRMAKEHADQVKADAERKEVAEWLKGMMAQEAAIFLGAEIKRAANEWRVYLDHEALDMAPIWGAVSMKPREAGDDSPGRRVSYVIPSVWKAGQFNSWIQALTVAAERRREYENQMAADELAESIKHLQKIDSYRPDWQAIVAKVEAAEQEIEGLGQRLPGRSSDTMRAMFERMARDRRQRQEREQALKTFGVEFRAWWDKNRHSIEARLQWIADQEHRQEQRSWQVRRLEQRGQPDQGPLVHTLICTPEMRLASEAIVKAMVIDGGRPTLRTFYDVLSIDDPTPTNMQMAIYSERATLEIEVAGFEVPGWPYSQKIHVDPTQYATLQSLADSFCQKHDVTMPPTLPSVLTSDEIIKIAADTYQLAPISFAPDFAEDIPF